MTPLSPSTMFRCWYCLATLEAASAATDVPGYGAKLLRFIDRAPFVPGPNDTEVCAWHAIVTEALRSPSHG